MPRPSSAVQNTAVSSLIRPNTVSTPRALMSSAMAWWAWMTRPEPLAALVFMRALPCFADRSVAPEQPMRTRSSNDHRGASTGTPATPSRPHTYAPVPSPARRPPLEPQAQRTLASWRADRASPAVSRMLCTHTAAVKRRMDSGKWTRPDQLLRTPPSAATTATPPASATTSTRSRRPPGGQPARSNLTAARRHVSHG